jgi:molybdopterin biosynthesis enzyme
MAFTLTPPTPADFPRLAEIAYTAFADDAFTRVAFRNVSRADNYAASLAGFAHLAPGTELVCAREAVSGTVVGYAQWSAPVQLNPAAPPHVHAPPPKGIDAVVFGEMIAEVGAAEARLTGGKPHWCAFRGGPATAVRI